MWRLFAVSLYSGVLLASGVPTVLRQDHLGTKARLAERGLSYSVSFCTDMLGNPVGGKARGFAYAGSLGAAVDVDFGKLCDFQGFEFFSSVVWRTGTNLSSRKIDNQFPVAQVFGSQTVRLNELFFKQTLWQKRFSIKIGRLDGGNDFLSSPLYNQFVSNAFCGNPIGIFYNMPFTAYPTATWGAYMETTPKPFFKVKLAVYNANNKSAQNRYHGINWTFKARPGVIWATEFDVLVNQKIPGRGYPGNYKVGFLYLTGHTRDFNGSNQAGDPCLYFLFDQMVYRKKNTQIVPFVTLLFAPPNRNQFPFFTSSGVVFYGPLANRPQDSASIGLAWGSYSQDQKGTSPQDFEAILEANYWFQISKSFIITPDVQYIIHPKGHAKTPNALVLGAQLELNF